MLNSPIDKVRGTLDLLPVERQAWHAAAAALEALLIEHGYRFVELPILEPTELFLRKVGQEMAGKLYAFRHHNRDLCLRPEVTASVIRAYVAHLQHAGLPQRLAYNGPVFRHETPQRGRYRQFTEIGVELLGAEPALADAEVIHLAAAGLERLGLRRYHVVIGHIGIAQSFLAGLALDERVRDWLTWSMEDLRRHGQEGLHHALDGLAPDAGDGAAEATLLAAVDAEGWSDLPPDEAQRLVLRVLRSAGFDLSGSSRTPEEIARRLVGKLARREQNRDLEPALDFLRRLAGLRGEPATVLADLRNLLAEERLSDAPLRQVDELLDYLAAFGLPTGRVTLDAGLGRGLHYYTGPIFEIYAGDGSEGDQLVGGGRYDELALVLGARERVPACGFAYGLERVVEALAAEGAPPAAPASPEVLVCAVSPVENAAAARLARQLRDEGRRVELDVRGRGVRANLEAANRRGIPFVAIVGEEERRLGAFVWRDMAAGHQEQRQLVASEA